jgi:2-hydroxychromene-2-carboxylate isomerase
MENVAFILSNGRMPDIDLYFDLGSPYAYLTAERIGDVLGEPVTWRPILLGGLFKLTGRSSWALGDYRRRESGMAEIERRTRRYGLAPIRWPDPWPGEYLFAMRAATYAFDAGVGREFTLRAYRDAFARGANLTLPHAVLEAARAVGLDPARVEEATRDPAIKQALRDASDAAFARGVIGVPTIAIGDELFWGDDRLEDAAAHLRAVAPR